MYDCPDIFSRTLPLAGEEMMLRLRDCHVLVAGVGGVGSWAVEALARSGVGHITIIDNDTVEPSNINRQLPAAASTLGRPKVQVMADRILDINPDCRVTAIRDVYTPENADRFDLSAYDYILDAIDSLRCKADLILRACRTRATLYSSMGAARKLHASMVTTAPFQDARGCPLARALRQYFRRHGTQPSRRFICVYSPENLPHRCQPDAEAGADGWSARKAAINGTFAHTTAIFGLTLAGLLIEDLYRKTT